MPDSDAPGPTVTIFARHGELVDDLARHVQDRGASTHTVAVESGWVGSVSRAILLVDSPAGRSAMRGLCDTADATAACVVALVEDVDDPGTHVCDRCRDHHGVTIIDMSTEGFVEAAGDQAVDGHRW